MDARNEFRSSLARARKLELDLADPDKIEMLSNIPPHMLGR